jgi:hypothetical protein
MIRRLRDQFSGACWAERVLFDVDSEIRFYEGIIAIQAQVAKSSNPPRSTLLDDVDAFGAVISPASETVIHWFLEKNLHRKCPVLYSVAMSIFTASPTTVSVERAISLVNRVVSERRSCMSQEKIESCIVLRDLSDLLPFALRKNIASLLGATIAEGHAVPAAITAPDHLVEDTDSCLTLDTALGGLNVDFVDVAPVNDGVVADDELVLLNNRSAFWWDASVNAAAAMGGLC